MDPARSAAAKQFSREREEAAYEAAETSRHAQLAEFTARQRTEDEVRCSATFVTSGSAPGYRDVDLTFDLQPVGDGFQQVMRTTIRVRSEDAEEVVRAIADVHRLAWRNAAPIDVKPDEQRPSWIERP
jgi:hypothetical protein